MNEAPAFDPHPHRAAALAELHARPAPRVPAPARVTRLVFAGGAEGERGRRPIDLLLAQAGLPARAAGARHVAIETDAGVLHWELHTEFVTYTMVERVRADGSADAPSFVDRLAALTGEAPPGPLVAIVTLDVRAGAQTMVVNGGCASRVFRDRATVSSSFLAQADGAVHFDVAVDALTPDETGVLCQRLVEIETYRMLTLTALPLARRIGALVQEIEAELGAVTQRLQDSRTVAASNAVFTDLSRLAARVEAEIAATAYRFSAALAYGAIVEDRLRSLHETSLGSAQPLSSFLSMRLTPALRTFTSMRDALADLAGRCARTSDLIRTRIDLQLAQQNNELLHALNERTRLQARLQETVEGLSVAAISYYILGLVGYVAKGAKEGGVSPFDPTIVVAVGAPVVVIAVALLIARIRRAHRDHAVDDSADAERAPRA